MFGGGFGGFGGHAPSRREPVDNSKLYETLGVAKDASPTEIKKAFRRQAIQHHPDKGGDPEKFKEIGKAYEVLSDSEKREAYDQFGESSLDGSGGGGGGAADIFDLFGGMGGARGRGRSKRRARGEDIVFPMKVSLGDMYEGIEKKLRLTKNILCQQCDGVGGDKMREEQCATCNGQGVRVHIRQIGPGMIQQAQSVCDACGGEGKNMPSQYRCKTCKGKKTMSKKVTIECHVEKGMKHGQRITFSQMADEAPGQDTGDVVVVLKQKEHENLVRKGNDLFMRRSITLSEALCGFEFDVEQLDARVLRVRSTPGVIYRPGSLKMIKNEGMPVHRNDFERGNLYLEFKVEFPEDNSLSARDFSLLGQTLPPGDSNAINKSLSDDSLELADLVDVDIEAEKQKREREANSAREQDEEEGDGRQHVGCQNQ